MAAARMHPQEEALVHPPAEAGPGRDEGLCDDVPPSQACERESGPKNPLAAK